ncbi:family 10 glycosylhydrolase [Peptostreptococcus equinus]|uniref:Family 10 glycosylhydrolase n=1 Tax=Peptostreptococcus equinus TaxID=3003601 RepID=A0ABY7JQV7_9FIRM|nr:family 10 glycosylhydrolase [Peptostreptococcus sp. CBA3647]WAW15529.1 family 10 glycosylhydrolase [Peptostreptococcus sp. CBA3647]
MRNKKFVISLFILFLSGIFAIYNIEDVNAEEEMRGAWVASVYNMDWPKTSYYNPSAQKAEYIKLLDHLKSTGINTVIFQVRPESDALYKSNINPWSRFLTGTQGKYPGYDPLQFVIDESHKRGIKVHAWFNPYRAWMNPDKSGSTPTNPMNLHPDWVIKYNNKWFYDPGKPEVTNYIVNTVNEVVRNYNIDGIHFDDYFYPDSNFPDYNTYKKYGSGNIDDWRRNNINNMLKKVNTGIKSIKPGLVFGVSPSGIWRNSSSDSNGSNTSGSESYAVQYADTRYWIKNNLIDYVVPQVYWKIGNTRADYATLIKWWSDQMVGSNVKLYIGQGIYKHGQDDVYGENVAIEIKNQILLNRKYPNIKGSMYFSASDIVNSSQVTNDLKSLYLARYPYQNSMMGANRSDTAVEISKKSWPNGTGTVVLVNGYEPYVGVISSPLASLRNAPILLSSKSYISEPTINEIKRLGAKKIILIGDENSIDKSQLDKLNTAISGLSYEKIYGKDIYEVSNKIAENISQNKPVNNVYVVGENGLADAISIASKASYERNPIIVTNYIKNNNPENVYFVGGDMIISNNIIKQISNVLSKDLTNSRIAGANRIDTNSLVVRKFYTKLFTKEAFVTRADALIDAVTISVFAQRTDSPTILAGKSINSLQNDVLYPRSVSLLYKVGGGINTYTYNKIYELLYGVMQ